MDLNKQILKTNKMLDNTEITMKYGEYKKLYRMYCHLESLVEYNELIADGQNFQFMVDHISERARITLEEYKNSYDSNKKLTIK